MCPTIVEQIAKTKKEEWYNAIRLYKECPNCGKKMPRSVQKKYCCNECMKEGIENKLSILRKKQKKVIDDD